MQRLFLDLETYSPVNLNKAGAYRYAEEAHILLIGWAADDGPVGVIDLLQWPKLPKVLLDAFSDPQVELVSHGDFDRILLERALNGRFLFVKERWHDTMARARAHSLPGGLKALCALYKLPEDQTKLSEEHGLIQLFCVPRTDVADFRQRPAKRPKEWARFVRYCAMDVEAMRALYRKLPMWNFQGRERKAYCLIETINDRGFKIDLELTEKAVVLAESETRRLNAQTQKATNNDVEKASQRDRLLLHICTEYGVPLENLRADTVDKWVNHPDTPSALREVLSLRQEASKTSTAKYKALLRSVCSDGRIRGALVFAGAGRTMRMSGKIFQPQNLPRTPKHLAKSIDLAIECIKDDSVALFFNNPLEVLVACIRGALVPKQGHKFSVADEANIEGRGLAWLADEKWKLQAFAAGKDLYVLGYARSFDVSVEEVLEDEQQGGAMRLLGKVQELSLGYGGSVGAFTKMLQVYLAFVSGKAKDLLLSLDEKRVRDIVHRWREANSSIVGLWYELERAARNAIRHPGVVFPARHVSFRRDGGWLRMRLPSGRYICYWNPEVEDDGKRSTLWYWGIDSYTKQWKRLSMWGGKTAEQATQAMAYDIFIEKLLDAEAAGYRIVLPVHDEGVAEVPDGDEYSFEKLGEIFTRPIVWTPGLPLGYGGYDGYRFKKK